jgi:phosphate transport system substrate-binding protein
MKLLAAALLACGASCAHADSPQVDPALPAWQPGPLDAQRIRIVGYNDMRHMLEQLVRRFNQAYPDVRIELDLPGTRLAPAALASGASALAPMGAEFTPEQLEAYRAVVKADPIGIRVAHASLAPEALSGHLAILVHRDNPLPSLTVAQVRQVFSGAARTWGDLGAKGSWAERSIVTYGVKPGTALAYELRTLAMGDAQFAPSLHGFPQSTDVVQNVEQDRDGIGFAAGMRGTPGVRALPIASVDGAEPIPLTAANVVSRRYPLARHLYIYVRPPLSASAREFMRLVLSREGQEAVAATPEGYLPLDAVQAREELARLDRAAAAR